MKTFLRVLLALGYGSVLVGAVPAQAQTFPNSTFDTWAVRNGVDAPTGWLTTDDLLGGIVPGGTGTVVKTSVARSGPFAAQIQTQNLFGVSPTPGVLILGSVLSGSPSGPTGIGGVPFTARPASLQFYYQLSGTRAVADVPQMSVFLTRRVNGMSTLVAGGSHTFTALAASYTLVTVPLTYASGLAPDTVSVVFFSGTAGTPTPGTVLRLDDLAFTGTATATRDAALHAAFTAGPNPSPDGRFVLQGLAPTLLSAPLAVLDATGRLVRRETAAPPATARPLDLSALPPGTYTVLLFTPDGLVTRKLVR